MKTLILQNGLGQNLHQKPNRDSDHYVVFEDIRKHE